MTLKRTILSICLAIGSVAMTCCTDLKFGADFLDKAPDGGMNRDSVFASRVYAERAVTEAYHALPFGLPYPEGNWGDKMGRDILECITDFGISDLGWSNESDKHYYNGQYNSAVTDMYRTKYSFIHEHCWESVRAAWNVIENIDGVPDMDETLKKQRKAEMKMVIAVHYTDMFRHFGGLPIIDKVINPGDVTQYPRATVEETVNFIVRLCNEAAPDLPWKAEAVDDGRFTKAGALACKVRVLLFAASPVFNDTQPYLGGEAATQHIVWYGDYQQSRWEAVIEACEEFFAENEANPYTLIDTGNPREDFRNGYFNRGNSEILISTRSTVNKIGNITDWIFQSIGLWGSGNATLNYLEMFPKTDGTAANNDWSSPITYEWPANGDPMLAKGNPFANRDPRCYETLVVLGDKKIGTGYWQIWQNGPDPNEMNPTAFKRGTKMHKFMFDHTRNGSSMSGKFLQWPWIRLSEIYLSYAEALNEAGSSGNGKYGDKYANIQKVRDRVDMPEVPNIRSMSKEEFREAILLERALEFGFEEVRWFDLVRWKMQEEFTKPLYWLSITRAKDGKTITLERKPVTDRYWKTNFSPKWYFSAIPLDEVQKGLVQNPGW